MTEQISSSQIAAFRLTRHHLAEGDRRSSVTEVCRDICGLQAQVMSAAQLALWARIPGLKKSRIEAALRRDRSLVKTYAMRGTLHLLTVEDFPLYLNAMQRSRTRQSLDIMARYGVSQAEAFRARDLAIEALGTDPMSRKELNRLVLDRMKPGKKARFFFEHANWGVTRHAVIEGLVCFGPNRGPEVSFVRVDRWLPKLGKYEESEAQEIVLSRFLSAYGPATVRDFAKWAGFPAVEAKAIWRRVKGELAEVEGEGRRAFILKKDEARLRESHLGKPVLRLLPNFDPYMLAHVEKDHLLDMKFYKRVYRNQGWISPAILLDGRVIGTWSIGSGNNRELKIEPFEKVSKIVRNMIDREAEGLMQFSTATQRAAPT